MNLNDYQIKAARSLHDREYEGRFMEHMLGLVGEAGEIAEKVKKIYRDKNGDMKQLDHDDMKAELGDVLWYVAMMADYFDIPLDEVGEKNINKLADRMKRNKIHGSGDNR